MDALHEDMLNLAENLLGAAEFGAAASRRAVSTAYYSVFQRLSSLCASRLSGQDSNSEEYRRLYRVLEHKLARTALNRDPFKVGLGVRFEQLQDVRHWADYSIAPHPDPDLAAVGKAFSSDEAREVVSKAREAMQFIDSLDANAQLKLAVLLLVRHR